MAVFLVFLVCVLVFCASNVDLWLISKLSIARFWFQGVSQQLLFQFSGGLFPLSLGCIMSSDKLESFPIRFIGKNYCA